MKAAAPAPAATPSRLWQLWLAWVVFVVYGSLVPLDFHPLPLDQAWSALMHAPMLKLGVQSRADWVANGVLYLPVGFLSTGMWLGAGPASATRRALAGAAGLVFGVLLAVGVELAQTAFPPRTVSQNDLLAEAIGSALGVVGAWLGAGHLRLLLSGYSVGGAVLARRLALFYPLLFAGMALFPFDFLVSAAEWQAKRDGGLIGLWLAGSSVALGLPKLLAKLVVETVVVLPLGALWASTRRVSGRRPAAQPALLGPALLLGALLGLVVELAQLAVASGQSQGASVLTRAIGFALGALAWQRYQGFNPEALRARLRQFTAPVLLLMPPLLLLYSGAWRGPWLAPGQALRRLSDEVHFVPFYYHYFNTEKQALVLLIVVCLSYAPLGLLGWAWHARPGLVVTLALLLSLLMEACKLVAQNTQPDPSNLWLAAAATWLAQALVQRLMGPPLRPALAAGTR